jgi:hypothetical protein
MIWRDLILDYIWERTSPLVHALLVVGFVVAVVGGVLAIVQPFA